jgi:hypothetical protein
MTGILLSLAAVLLLLSIVLCQRRAAGDPEHIAATETRMWQAYYGRSHLRLFWELIRLLRSQFSMTLFDAIRTGHLLARSALRFKAARDHYEEVALPDLIRAYSRIRLATGRGFDPATVARAELAWWVARRTPGEKSPEQVGERIGEFYAAFYETQSPLFLRAGLLRAQAAHRRYLANAQPDWQDIQATLTESYRLLANDPTTTPKRRESA